MTPLNQAVLTEILQYHQPDPRKAPTVVWLRLLNDIRDIINIRYIGFAPRYTFYHKKYANIISEMYNDDAELLAVRNLLVDYIIKLADPHGDKTYKIHHYYAVIKLPELLLLTKRYEELDALLTDIDFIEVWRNNLDVHSVGYHHIVRFMKRAILAAELDRQYAVNLGSRY